MTHTISKISFYDGDISTDNIKLDRKCWAMVSFVLDGIIEFRKIVIYYNGEFGICLPDSSAIFYVIIDSTFKELIENTIIDYAKKYYLEEHIDG
jgi:hypothetical protein